MMIETDRLIIRDFVNSDSSFFTKLETHPYTYHYEKDQCPTPLYVSESFSNIMMLQTSDIRIKYSLLITHKETLKPLGRVVLWETDDDIKEWEIGWSIWHEEVGKGYATKAAQALIDFAFHTLQVHRIQALCHEDYISSEKVMIKLHMKKEGLLRGIKKLHDSWVNMMIYAILDSDINPNN